MRNVVKDLTAEIFEKVPLTVVEQEYVRSSDLLYGEIIGSDL